MIPTPAPTKFRSRWDWSTWLIIGLVAACCYSTLIVDDDIVMPTIVCLCMLVFIVILFIGTYYVIDGDKLIVYTAFFKQEYPIDKIAKVAPTKSMLSAPALSLTPRLAITFTDRKVMKSVMPLVISPVRRSQFIALLLRTNPQITTTL